LQLKLFLRIILYLSFVFLIIYLYTKELLIIPDLANPGYFFVSVMLVLVGFLISVKGWHVIVKTEIPGVLYKDAFVSTGKFIFSKYIPGKLWVIIGKAGYLKEKYNKSIFNLSSLSFYYQLIVIFSASVTGIIFVYFIDKVWFYALSGVIIILLIFFISLYKPSLSLISKLLCIIFKKEIKLPNVSKKLTLKLFLISFANWIIWSFSFYVFLLSALPSESVVVSMGFLFPVSTAVGIIVIIAPGGIGIREGLLTAGLIFFGLQAKEAVSIAFISRIWFLLGEALFFLVAVLLEHKRPITQK